MQLCLDESYWYFSWCFSRHPLRAPGSELADVPSCCKSSCYSPVSKPEALFKVPSKASSARTMRGRSWEKPFGVSFSLQFPKSTSSGQSEFCVSEMKSAHWSILGFVWHDHHCYHRLGTAQQFPPASVFPSLVSWQALLLPFCPYYRQASRDGHRSYFFLEGEDVK